MKKVGFNCYVHKTGLNDLYKTIGPDAMKRVQDALCYMFEHDKPFEVVKYNTKSGDISLIDAIGWKERYEPIVGTSVIFKADGTIKERPNGKQVYHMKEVFVPEWYTGFDIEEAERRTKLLNAFPYIKENKSRMGSLEWWTTFLKAYHLPTYMGTRYKDMW